LEGSTCGKGERKAGNDAEFEIAFTVDLHTPSQDHYELRLGWTSVRTWSKLSRRVGRNSFLRDFLIVAIIGWG